MQLYRNAGSAGVRSYHRVQISRSLTLRGRCHSLEQVGFVKDFVGVTLFGEKKLAVMRKVHLTGVASDQGVEPGGLVAFLRSQNPTEALCFFLSAPERAGDLDHHIGVGQIDGEVTDLRENQLADLARSEGTVKLFAFAVGGLPP